MVNGINYRDLSYSRSGDIVRELQQVNEVLKTPEEKPRNSLVGNSNSPYAPDRLGEEKILGTDIEVAWKRRLDLLY